MLRNGELDNFAQMDWPLAFVIAKLKFHVGVSDLLGRIVTAYRNVSQS